MHRIVIIALCWHFASKHLLGKPVLHKAEQYTLIERSNI